jgi:ribosomal protein S18 acetylase RimI-like enzyme
VQFATVDKASLAAFLSVSAASQFQEQLSEYAESLLQQGYTRPEWCLLGLEDSKPVAGAALWSPPDHDVPTDVVLIETDWKDPPAGRALMRGVHELARANGADALSHHVDDPPGPPQYQEHEDARIRLLLDSGYEELRDGLRWRYAGSADDAEEHLMFRALPEVGEDAFVDAIASTYAGTRDSWINQTIEERGALGAARADFADYRELDHLPEWWELAYTPDGELAGVIMSARNPTSAVVAYVGVVPEQRGRGLATQLVRHGTAQLLATGASEIRGDCDRDNIGMIKAFERAGYEQFARRRSFRRAL